MGDARLKQKELEKARKPCIFCGGQNLATTKEHCPPRSMFRDRQWPVGYDFPACESCNGGSSNSDLIVAFMAHMRLAADDAQFTAGVGLMKSVNRQVPNMLASMFLTSSNEARMQARKLGMRPGPGQTYRDLGIANITGEMQSAVEVVAAKLTKAVYNMQTGAVFPADGGIMFLWFTNAQLLEHGKIFVLDAMASIAAMSPTISRNGKDLRDQFDYKYSTDVDGALHVMQTVFGTVFGFVTIFSQIPGRLESIADGISNALRDAVSPFKFLSSNSPKPSVPKPPTC